MSSNPPNTGNSNGMPQLPPNGGNSNSYPTGMPLPPPPLPANGNGVNYPLAMQQPSPFFPNSGNGNYQTQGMHQPPQYVANVHYYPQGMPQPPPLLHVYPNYTGNLVEDNYYSGNYYAQNPAMTKLFIFFFAFVMGIILFIFASTFIRF